MSNIFVIEIGKGGSIIRPATLEDFQRKDNPIFIRSATLEDVPAMLISEEKTWPDENQGATKDQIISRIKIFPEGEIIAIQNGKVLGIAASEIMDYPWGRHIPTFHERDDGGFIRNHDSMGETLCGINIGTIPEAPRNVATALIQATKAIVIKMGIRYLLASPVLPGFSSRKDKSMTAAEYAAAKNKKNEPLDPVVRLFEREDFVLNAVLPDYFRDAESEDNSAIMRWTNPLLPYSFEERFNHSTGRPEVFLIFGLPIGCHWAKQAGGGCTNCGFEQGIADYCQEMERLGMNLTDFVSIFDRALLHLGKTENIVFYTGGSFFEVPDYLTESLFRRLNQIGQIKEVMIETMPEFVTLGNLQKIKKIARPDIQIKIAIGLESASDKIRLKKINKGFTREDYIRAVRLIKAADFVPCAYVLLKPLGLSEEEAVQDAIETIKWSHSVGSELTLLQAAFVQDGTPLAERFKKGEYQPPTLWSILDILVNISQNFPIYLGHFEDYPPPIARPANCGRCDAEVNTIFDNYRVSNTLSDQLPKCVCQNKK